MPYDYNKYMREYNKNKIVTITIKLHKENDKDILEAIDLNNKSQSIKRLIRKGLKNDSIYKV